MLANKSPAYYLLLFFLEHNGYICEPTLSYKFDLTCAKTVYDESRQGNNAQMLGHSTISSKLQTRFNYDQYSFPQIHNYTTTSYSIFSV